MAKQRLRPQRSVSLPHGIISAAITSRNTVIAVCTPCTVVSRSTLMSLIITFMFEPAKLQMNCASASGSSTPPGERRTAVGSVIVIQAGEPILSLVDVLPQDVELPYVAAAGHQDVAVVLLGHLRVNLEADVPDRHVIDDRDHFQSTSQTNLSSCHPIDVPPECDRRISSMAQPGSGVSILADAGHAVHRIRPARPRA